MRNFILFFEEKEGTSPLVRLLDHFDQISVVRQVEQRGWEPFDRHNCGWLSSADLGKCLTMLFDDAPADMDSINAVYTRRGAAPLDTVDKGCAVGFKMRLLAPHPIERAWLALRRADWSYPFASKMVPMLQANDVTVLLAVRQDVFRWALSKYHGDGTGKPGHLQFKLASGSIKHSDISKIYVDPRRFEKTLSACEESHGRKRRLMTELQEAGLRVHPLLYEEFLTDKKSYLTRLLECLEIQASANDIDAALQEGAYFKKVHSDDISEFVENHEELIQQFGERYIPW